MWLDWMDEPHLQAVEMATHDIRDAAAHLSSLIEKSVANGESFVIAKEGRPLVKVTPIASPTVPTGKRIGFMKGMGTIPEDFDEIMAVDIVPLFEGDAT